MERKHLSTNNCPHRQQFGWCLRVSVEEEEEEEGGGGGLAGQAYKPYNHGVAHGAVFALPEFQS